MPNSVLTLADLGFTPPEFPIDRLHEELQRQYGLSGELAALTGERDQNHRLRAADGRQYVFKVSAAGEPFDVVDFQTQALLHLASVAPELPVPRVTPTLSGDSIGRIANGANEHALRLLSYLPGVPYVDGDRADQGALFEIGRFQGRLAAALSGFEHQRSRYFMPWDVTNGLLAERPLWQQGGADIQAYEPRLRPYFATQLLPALAGMRKQVIHNDLHSENLLRPDRVALDICGVIDFGDMIRAPRLLDIAVMTTSFVESSDDPVAATAQIVRGANAVTPLEPQEIDWLYGTMLARSALSVLLFDIIIAGQQLPSISLRRVRNLLMKTFERLIAVDRIKLAAAVRAACTERETP